MYYLFSLHLETLQDLVQMYFLDRLFALLAEREVSQENGRVERERIHILRRRSIHLPGSSQHRTLRLRLGRRDDVRNPHEREQPLTLGIVLPGHPDRPPGEALDFFGRARLLGFLVLLLRLGLALEALGQLAGL